MKAPNAYAEKASGDVRKMVGEDGTRLRIGDYRIIFTESEAAIEIRAVGHRKDIYR